MPEAALQIMALWCSRALQQQQGQYLQGSLKGSLCKPATYTQPRRQMNGNFWWGKDCSEMLHGSNVFSDCSQIKAQSSQWMQLHKEVWKRDQKIVDTGHNFGACLVHITTYRHMDVHSQARQAISRWILLQEGDSVVEKHWNVNPVYQKWVFPVLFLWHNCLSD